MSATEAFIFRGPHPAYTPEQSDEWGPLTFETPASAWGTARWGDLGVGHYYLQRCDTTHHSNGRESRWRTLWDFGVDRHGRRYEWNAAEIMRALRT